MDGYEDVVARQPAGQFSNRRERQKIRASSEHFETDQRYRAERRRRFDSFKWWLGGALVGLPLIKFLVDLISGKG